MQEMLQDESRKKHVLDWSATVASQEPETAEAAIAQYLDPERRVSDLMLSKVKSCLPQETYTSIEG